MIDPPPSPSAPLPTVDSVARRVVARCAPEEELYYPQLRDDFLARGSAAARTADNPLGFGEIAVGLVTGVVLTVLHELVVESVADTVRPWWQRAWDWTLRRLRLTRVAPDPRAPVPPLPADRIPDVAAAVTEHAVRAHLPPERAAELARAVVAELTVADGDSDDRSGR